MEAPRVKATLDGEDISEEVTFEQRLELSDKVGMG